jgi:hypothetical protein
MSRDEQERLRDIKDAIAMIHRHLANANETAASRKTRSCTTPFSFSS